MLFTVKNKLEKQKGIPMFLNNSCSNKSGFYCVSMFVTRNFASLRSHLPQRLGPCRRRSDPSSILDFAGLPSCNITRLASQPDPQVGKRLGDTEPPNARRKAERSQTIRGPVRNGWTTSSVSHPNMASTLMNGHSRTKVFF